MNSLQSAGALVFAFPCLAIAQIATLHVRVTAGDGAPYAPASRAPRPLAVVVTDENGRPLSGAAVSFHLPESGPGGLFANGLRTDVAVTNLDGRAVSRDLHLNRTPGAFEVRIIASRDQARAGAWARLSVAPPETPGRPLLPVRARSGRKWISVALVAAGVAGALTAGLAARSSPKPVVLPVSIGPPVIVIGGR